MRAALRLVPLAALVLLTAAPSAGAAIVQLRSARPGGPPATLQVVALPAQPTALTFTAPGDGSVVVADGLAPLVPGRGCSGGGASVTCTAASALPVVVTGGAGSRSVSLATLPGYPGSELGGGAGADVLIGGTAADHLTGLEGDDVLSGGAGDDSLNPGPGADIVRGGAGIDRVDYSGVRTPLVITLDDRPDDGPPGAAGNVGTDVEVVVGGRGDDRITGSPGPDDLDGGDGTDTLDGGAGDDRLADRDYEGVARLTGGPGRDALDAGLNGVVDVGDGERDTVRCDRGLARPLRADPIDELVGCAPPAAVRTTRAAARDGRVRLRLTCEAVEQDCRVRVVLRRGRTRLARRALTARPGTATVTLRLNARGRALAVAGDVRACVTVTSTRTAPPSEAPAAGCQALRLDGGA